MVPLPRNVEPDQNWIAPVGAGPLGDRLSVAVHVVVSPTLTGEGAPDTVMKVGARSGVRLTAAELLPAHPGGPEKLAVSVWTMRLKFLLRVALPAPSTAAVPIGTPWS